MRGVEYAELETFLAVARLGSFRRAADSLAISPSAVSHTLRALEARLGVRLFNRTTRSVALTHAGLRLQRRLDPAFLEITDALDEAVAERGRPSGTVRLTAPRVAVQMAIAPRIADFCTMYPEIKLDVVVDDALIDSVAEGYDAGIRLNEQVSRNMLAADISGPLKGAVVGSPRFFETNGRPMSPRDLLSFQCLNYRLAPSGRLLPWEFCFGEETMVLEPDGPLCSNDSDLLIQAALDGVGIACITEATVLDHLRTGRLLKVLDEWCQSFPGWQMYYPKNRHISPALSALILFFSADV